MRIYSCNLYYIRCVNDADDDNIDDVDDDSLLRICLL